MFYAWNQPQTNKSALYDEMLQQDHLCIAGTTGSGKTVMIRNLLTTAATYTPADYQFVLIDPKRLSLKPFKKFPHTLAHVTSVRETIDILDAVINIMERRFKTLEESDEEEFNGSKILVVIDELADLQQQAQKEITDRICRLGRLGRQVKIMLIVATQSPQRAVLTASIMQNMTSCLALRCKSAIESRQIIGISGAEELPRYGEGIYISPDYMKPKTVLLPMIPKEETSELAEWWAENPGQKSFFKKGA